eukprot:scaffold20974_cov32-Tisochrysis_lutea.AAC.3
MGRAEDSPCPRGPSREARALVSSRLIALVREAGGGELPPSCALTPNNDALAAHEAAKRRLSSSHWKCSFCSKAFSSERYLDLHLHRKHVDALPNSAMTCLADHCDVLRCPAWVSAIREPPPQNLEPLHSSKGLPLAQGDHPQQCSEVRMDMRRKQCRALMHACAFGPAFIELDME